MGTTANKGTYPDLRNDRMYWKNLAQQYQSSYEKKIIIYMTELQQKHVYDIVETAEFSRLNAHLQALMDSLSTSDETTQAINAALHDISQLQSILIDNIYRNALKDARNYPELTEDFLQSNLQENHPTYDMF